MADLVPGPGFLAGPALLAAVPEGDKVLDGPVVLGPAFFGSVGFVAFVPLAGSAAAALVLRDGGVVSAEAGEGLETDVLAGVLSAWMDGLGDAA